MCAHAGWSATVAKKHDAEMPIGGIRSFVLVMEKTGGKNIVADTKTAPRLARFPNSWYTHIC